MTTARGRIVTQVGEHVFLLGWRRDLEFTPPLHQTLQFVVVFRFGTQGHQIVSRAEFWMLHQLPGTFTLTSRHPQLKLAAWGAADKADGGDKAKTEQFMTQFLKNVEVFDTGGRGATTTFAERGLGDVLISFESEVNNIRKQYEAQGFEVVIPKTNILAEFPVAWVDKNVEANGTEKAAKDYR
jgi:hypothetical protein